MNPFMSKTFKAGQLAFFLMQKAFTLPLSLNTGSQPHLTAFRKSAITDLAELSVFRKMEKYDYADLSGIFQM